MVFSDGHAASLDVNHFMSLKDAGHILTGGQDGEVYFPEDRSVENY